MAVGVFYKRYYTDKDGVAIPDKQGKNEFCNSL